ncbi:hypothetical protein L7F22_005197 [Adiantum nelumboides]|nr:hypothetical protein [Adiantum nelumboides]
MNRYNVLSTSCVALSLSLSLSLFLCAWLWHYTQPISSLNTHKHQLSHGLIPVLYTYIANRRNAVALHPFFNLLEGGLGVQFDRSVLDCHLLMQLKFAASDHAAWVNDLLSFNTKYTMNGGDFCNIFAVVLLQPSSPGYGNLQKSVDIVSKMIEQRDQDFARLLEEAQCYKSFIAKAGMAEYLRGIADWLPGNLPWTYATARYCDDVNLQGPRMVNAPLTIHLI